MSVNILYLCSVQFGKDYSSDPFILIEVEMDQRVIGTIRGTSVSSRN